jgi:hypothetical protein
MKAIVVKYKDDPRFLYTVTVFFNLGKSRIVFEDIVAPNETIAVIKLAPKLKKLYAITNICTEFIRVMG